MNPNLNETEVERTLKRLAEILASIDALGEPIVKLWAEEHNMVVVSKDDYNSLLYSPGVKPLWGELPF